LRLSGFSHYCGTIKKPSRAKAGRLYKKHPIAPRRVGRSFTVVLHVFVDFFGKIDWQKNRHDNDETNREYAQKADFTTEQFLQQHGSFLLQGG
jgi:hypothetical protein